MTFWCSGVAMLLIICALFLTSWQYADADVPPQGPAWHADVQAGRVWSVEVVADDGDVGSVEVLCDAQRRVRLYHPTLTAARERSDDRREGWYRTVDIISGFGLDLDTPAHHGARTYWMKCQGVDQCLEQSGEAARWTIWHLVKGWSWHIRIPQNDGSHVDMRIPLTGSRDAIERVCGAVRSPAEEDEGEIDG